MHALKCYFFKKSVRFEIKMARLVLLMPYSKKLHSWPFVCPRLRLAGCLYSYSVSLGIFSGPPEPPSAPMSAAAFILGRRGKPVLMRATGRRTVGQIRCLSGGRGHRARLAVAGSDLGQQADWESLGIWLDSPVDLPPTSSYFSGILRKLSVSSVGHASQRGKRRENEDRFSISRLSEDVMIFAVFDGHGGDSAAEFCSRNLSHLIQWVQGFLVQHEAPCGISKT